MERRRFICEFPLAAALAAALLLAALAGGEATVSGQSLPNPYRIVDGWAQLPGGKPLGAVGKATIDRDGRHVWAIVRCEPLADPARFGTNAATRRWTRSTSSRLTARWRQASAQACSSGRTGWRSIPTAAYG